MGDVISVRTYTRDSVTPSFVCYAQDANAADIIFIRKSDFGDENHPEKIVVSIKKRLTAPPAP